MTGQIEWPVDDLLARQARSTPGEPALVEAESGKSWSYDGLSNGPVDGLAAGLDAAGMGPGDHLGVLAAPGLEVATLVHAAARAGVVLVPLPPNAPEEILRDRCAAAAVEAVVAMDPADQFAGETFAGRTLTYHDLAASAGNPPNHPWASDDVQWLVFTSGTTGDPSPVQLTAGNLHASATASAERLAVTDDDRWLACLPMHHLGGLAPLVRAPLDGFAVVVQTGFDVDATAAAMETYDVSGVSLVPTMLSRLLDAGWQPPDTIRLVLLGGAPASAELINRCESAEVPVFPTYGATETASQIATATPAEAFEHPGTVGRPLMGTKVDIVDHAGSPLPTGESGELVVSGPTVSPGYYGETESPKPRLAGGSFHTRDRGYRDEVGRVWVTGRLDRAIVTGGETVQPDRVETVLQRHPAVDEAVVVGLEDDEWGEVVGALVTGPPPARIDAVRLGTHCRDRLDAVAVPKLIEVVESLPRTPSGTVDRNAVRERLRAARRRGGL